MAEIAIVFIVLALRILIPFSILRWPFWGMVASMIADTFDITLMKWFGWETFGFAGYQLTDKLLDLYYLSFGLYKTAELEQLFAQRTLRILYFWRFAGVIMFEVTGFRWLLFAAPNIFEFLYLALFGLKTLFRRQLTKKIVITALLFSALLKLPQEYVMHYKEFRWGIGNFFEGVEQLYHNDTGN